MSDLKKILVTGASRGIGRAICDKLLSEGHQVIGLARFSSEKPIDHPHFTAYPLNFSRIEELPERLKELAKNFEIDALICAAGRGSFGNLEEISYGEIQSILELNFLSQVYLIKAFLPAFKKQKKGNILLIGSEAGLSGKQKGSIYCASKFALRGFAQALREECSHSFVRVTLINPGMVATDFFNDLAFRPGELVGEHLVAEDVAEAVSYVLQGRIGSVCDEINLSPQKKRIHFSKSKTFSEEI